MAAWSPPDDLFGGDNNDDDNDNDDDDDDGIMKDEHDDDDMSHTSADWMVSTCTGAHHRHNSALTHAADPWNHPLLIDCDGTNNSNSNSNSNNDSFHHHPTKQPSESRVSMDATTTESWMTDDDDLAALSHDDEVVATATATATTANDPSPHSNPLWMEGLEWDPILSSTASLGAATFPMLFLNNTDHDDANDDDANDANDANDYRSPLRLGEIGIYPNFTTSNHHPNNDEDEDDLNLLVMDEMECLMDDTTNNESGTLITVSSASVSSSSDSGGGSGVNRLPLTLPSPPSSFGLVPFHTATASALAVPLTNIKDTATTKTAMDATTVSSSSPTPASAVVFEHAPVSSAHFHERRELLAASMRASHISRQVLHMKEHVERRQVLQTVLAEIEQSTVTVQRHCLLLLSPLSSSSSPSCHQDNDNEPNMGIKTATLSPTKNAAPTAIVAAVVALSPSTVTPKSLTKRFSSITPDTNTSSSTPTTTTNPKLSLSESSLSTLGTSNSQNVTPDTPNHTNNLSSPSAMTQPMPTCHKRSVIATDDTESATAEIRSSLK